MQKGDIVKDYGKYDSSKSAIFCEDCRWEVREYNEVGKFIVVNNINNGDELIIITEVCDVFEDDNYNFRIIDILRAKNEKFYIRLYHWISDYFNFRR